MSWDSLTLFTLAGFGFLTLVITQLKELIAKLPDLIREFHAVQRALKDGKNRTGE